MKIAAAALLLTLGTRPAAAAGSPIKEFLFIGHSRSMVTKFTDPRFENIDYSRYEMLLLGGDMALATSGSTTTLRHLEKLFRLRETTTLLALGNHDIENIPLLLQYTAHPEFYEYLHDGILFIVLNTQRDGGYIKGPQLDLVRKSLGSLKKRRIRNVILLTHKLIWLRGSRDEPGLEVFNNIPDGQFRVANGKFGDCVWCTPKTNFYEDVYPLLAQAAQSGLGVYAIAGDLGDWSKRFGYTTRQGVHLVGSGGREGTPDAELFVLTHNTKTGKLTHRFELLNDLTKN